MIGSLAANELADPTSLLFDEPIGMYEEASEASDWPEEACGGWSLASNEGPDIKGALWIGQNSGFKKLSKRFRFIFQTK